MCGQNYSLKKLDFFCLLPLEFLFIYFFFLRDKFRNNDEGCVYFKESGHLFVIFRNGNKDVQCCKGCIINLTMSVTCKYDNTFWNTTTEVILLNNK